MSDNDKRLDYGEDVLTAIVRGDSIDAMKLAALDKAVQLYGHDARLEIESVSDITTSHSGEGAFMAHVRVRHLDGA